MIYLSALLPTLYPADAETLFTALAAHDVPYALLDAHGTSGYETSCRCGQAPESWYPSAMSRPI